MLLSWDKLLSFVEIVVVVFSSYFFSHFIQKWKGHRLLWICEWKSYLCTAHTHPSHVYWILNAIMPLSQIYLSHQFSTFSLGKGGGTENFSWWLLSFNFVFILSLYAVRTLGVDGGWLRMRPCMCVSFGTGDIKPFSDLFFRNIPMNFLQTHSLKGKIYFIFVVYCNVVVFVNTILCFQHTFYP